MGAIRGGVYEDVNGDGDCVVNALGNRRPVPGVDVQFRSAGTSLSLYSGADGTFGLTPVTPGSWQVKVKPNPDIWLATSANPQIEADYTWPIHFWISAPFHLVPIIDPALETVGFGRHNQEVGNFKMASVLDVRSNLTEGPVEASYPIYFPGDGAATWVVRHSLYEWPDPMSSCPGYARPSGPPLVLQLGAGDQTPGVSSHAVTVDGQLLESCLFDETSYSNPDPWAQSTGRVILDERDAVVIIPRHPLAVDKTYQVEVTADGQSYSWQFTTQRGPEG